jgi:tetratricopeptide (TPR) repeat protein
MSRPSRASRRRCPCSASRCTPRRRPRARGSSSKTTWRPRRRRLEKAPNEADALIWLGRRTAYLGRYRDTIEIFTKGIAQHPNDARMYRHRGHRYLTVREFDRAIADFDKAAALVAGKPDEIEPDGQPNARNTPTSTLQSNIFYHLALAHYLKGDFEKAADAYRRCMAVSKNPDMLVATTHWYYMTLRRLDRKAEADKLLEPITADMDIIENRSYHELLMMYKGQATPESLLSGSGLDGATKGYGVANWHLYNGRQDEARKILTEIVENNAAQWPAFGYLAAEADLARMRFARIAGKRATSRQARRTHLRAARFGGQSHVARVTAAGGSGAPRPAGAAPAAARHWWSTWRRSTTSLFSQTPPSFLTISIAADIFPRVSPPAASPASSAAMRRIDSGPLGRLERLDHPGHHRLAGEDVALRRAELPGLVAGPLRGLGPGVHRVVPLRVHHRELASGLRPRLIRGSRDPDRCRARRGWWRRGVIPARSSASAFGP